MLVTQPRVLKRTSVMRPSCVRTERCKTSPHTGFVTSTEAVAFSSSPALRGCSKWSITKALNTQKLSGGKGGACNFRAENPITLNGTAPENLIAARNFAEHHRFFSFFAHQNQSRKIGIARVAGAQPQTNGSIGVI